MPIIRKQLKPSDVYPDDIRYNSDTETVQSLIDGEWVDNPAADPRTQTTLPARITSDSACDAAESVVDALKGQIDGILTAIDNGQTAASIAGLVLGLLSFGVFAIFINIALAVANAMLDAGTVALSAALTNPVYEQLKCILYCHMNDEGRIIAGHLGAIQTEVTDEIGGLAATTLNSMLSLAGEGGLNNLASLGTSTGDCSSCNCPSGLVALTGVPADPGTIVEVAPNVWRLTTTFRPASGGLVSSNTVYVEKEDSSCWKVTSATLISGSFVGVSPTSNCPGLEYLDGTSTYHLDTPAVITGVNGVDLFWCGWRSEAPFTIEIEIEFC